MGEKHHFSKKVVQIDKNTNETIKIFSCAAQAQREISISYASISMVCRGIRKTAGGYKWNFFKIENK